MTEDRSHSASHEARQGADETPGAGKRHGHDPDLEALLQSWSAEGEAAPPPPRGVGVRARAMVTGLLVVLAGLVMYQTRHDVAWWLEPSEPRPIGDLRALYRANTPLPALETNSHVSVSGLVPTRLIPVKLEGLSDGASPDQPMEYIFYCPLLQALVVTDQPIVLPTDRIITVDPAFEKLLVDRLAFPEDLAVEVAVTGRLQRADEGPRALAPFVDRVARRLGLSPSAMWVLEDGRQPSDSAWAAIVWGLAVLGVGLSIFFLVRAVRARPAVPSA